MALNFFNYLSSLYNPKIGGFHFHRSAPVTLLSTCFGIQLAYLINAIDNFEPNTLGGYIKGMQRDDGVFWDDTAGWVSRGSHAKDYVEFQKTFFSLIALDMLGLSPSAPLRFMKQFENGTRLRDWLENRNWINFWYSSNELMFVLFFMILIRDRYQEKISVWNSRIHQVFDLLEKKQNSKTGFWGDFVEKDPANGLFGAAHICLFYEYEKRPIQFAQEMRQTTLSLQNQNGLFGHRFGGACEDYDAVDVLLRTCSNVDQEAKEAIKKVIHAIHLSKKSNDTGMSYRLVLPGLQAIFYRFIDKIKGGKINYYSGLKAMEYNMYKADLWSTYFRCMTLALSDFALHEKRLDSWKFYNLPGWGYGKISNRN